MQPVDHLPRLGIFLDGDTVGNDRREELQRLPKADHWQFVAEGRQRPHSLTGNCSHMQFTLRYVGKTDAL